MLLCTFLQATDIRCYIFTFHTYHGNISKGKYFTSAVGGVVGGGVTPRRDRYQAADRWSKPPDSWYFGLFQPCLWQQNLIFFDKTSGHFQFVFDKRRYFKPKHDLNQINGVFAPVVWFICSGTRGWIINCCILVLLLFTLTSYNWRSKHEVMHTNLIGQFCWLSHCISSASSWLTWENQTPLTDRFMQHFLCSSVSENAQAEARDYKQY